MRCARHGGQLSTCWCPFSEASSWAGEQPVRCLVLWSWTKRLRSYSLEMLALTFEMSCGVRAAMASQGWRGREIMKEGKKEADMKDARVAPMQTSCLTVFQCLGGPLVLPTTELDEIVLCFYNGSSFHLRSFE